MSYTGWVDISPRFMGLAIRVPMIGQRTLTLTPAGGAATEHYKATIPAMEWHFIPSVRAEYSGTWRLWCEETGLAAEVRCRDADTRLASFCAACDVVFQY